MPLADVSSPDTRRFTHSPGDTPWFGSPLSTRTCASASRSRCTSRPADAAATLALRASPLSSFLLAIMKILVLGSGAGGGFPQWNCNCTLCGGARRGTTRAAARTQSSIAVSADGENWVLVNASPDLGMQLRKHPALHPRGAP